jgi:hypothetical protein
METSVKLIRTTSFSIAGFFFFGQAYFKEKFSQYHIFFENSEVFRTRFFKKKTKKSADKCSNPSCKTAVLPRGNFVSWQLLKNKKIWQVLQNG